MTETTIFTDWDGSATIHGKDTLHPPLATVWDRHTGGPLELAVATGRLPGQMHILGNEQLREILSKNKKNSKSIQIYGGGSIISDAEGNIYHHNEHLLEEDQLKVIADVVFDLIAAGGEPFIATQAAEVNLSGKTEWKNGPTAMLHTNPSQVTPIREKMYITREQMPKTKTELVKFLKLRNPAKVMIISSAALKISPITEFRAMAKRLDSHGLGVQGNHYEGMDIVKKGINKASAIEKVTALLNILKVDIFVGDSFGEHGNDRPVFEAAHLVRRGIVVANGKENDMSFAQIPYDLVNDVEALAAFLENLLNKGEL